MAEGVLNFSVNDGVALIVIDSPPVNALSHRVRLAICDGVKRALADDAAKAIVLACAGRTFFAGADVTELNRPIEPPLLADIMTLYEASTKPVIAALHGTALGGGFELALACHYRVAVRSAKVGLPEVALGLIPGAGGTQRLPRLIGVAAAVEAIGLGKTIAAPEAKTLGVIDELAEGADPVAAGVAFARAVIERRSPLRRVRDLPVDLELTASHAVFDAFRAAHPELFVGLKAPNGVLQAIEAAVTLPFDEGLQRERTISRALTTSPESAAQRHLFFAERAAAKAPGGEKLTPSATPSVALLGDARDIEAWAKLFERGGVAVTDANDAAHLVVEVTTPFNVPNAPRHLGFKQTGNLIEIAYREATGPQALVDAMAVVKRLALAGVFVAARDGLVIDRLAAKAPAIANEPSDLVAAEVFAILEEGVAARGSDIDFAMTRAGRWPIWLGGPVFWAEQQGLDALAARLAARGERVPPLLAERAAAKTSA